MRPTDDLDDDSEDTFDGNLFSVKSVLLNLLYYLTGLPLYKPRNFVLK